MSVALQRSLLDSVALVLGVCFSLASGQGQLTARLPQQHLCRFEQLAMLTAQVVLAASLYGLTCWYLTIQPWYTGGTGSSHQVHALSTRHPYACRSLHHALPCQESVLT